MRKGGTAKKAGYLLIACTDLEQYRQNHHGKRGKYERRRGKGNPPVHPIPSSTPPASAAPIFEWGNSGALYIVEPGKRRRRITVADALARGYSFPPRPRSCKRHFALLTEIAALGRLSVAALRDAVHTGAIEAVERNGETWILHEHVKAWAGPGGYYSLPAVSRLPSATAAEPGLTTAAHPYFP